jgi:hypothetical protein
LHENRPEFKISDLIFHANPHGIVKRWYDNTFPTL